VLWNAAEAAERRRDAQVAREVVLALPADAELSTQDRIALARSFAEQHFVSQGLAVQLDVHAPHGADSENERANWHAHLLITTRRLEGEAFAAKKARDLDPEVRHAAGRPRVADGAAWGELWRAHQDRYFEEHGFAARVDPAATHAQEHVGPVRMRRSGAEIVQRAETIRQANQEAARDPAQVLATLTRNNATFAERDLDRFLTKQLGPGPDGRAAEEIAAVRAKVLAHRDLVPLYDRESGTAAERFTTRQVRSEEREALSDAAGLAGSRAGAVSRGSAKAAEAARTLRPDQAAAFAHATGAGHLKLIEGRAGTGKSYTLAAIRDAHERDGKRVVGLAPTNAVAQDLAADGFAEAGTVHSALFKLKNGRAAWDRNTVVVVDEAAMLDTRVTGELLSAARQAGAKLVLAGDDRQLASIERGGLFAEMRAAHGAAEITEVTRQKVDWQRQAARDLAEGRFAEAVGAFDKAGAITWTQDQHDARRALVSAWKKDGEERPGQSRFVFAYTNRDVDALNAELRQVRRERGELTGADVELNTRHGPAAFAEGDRVQFTGTDKTRGIYNGNVGTITRIDAGSGQIVARLDAAGGAGREVSWSAADFEGFRHGYAGTIYKGQGKTLDRTYLYHTEHWRSAASYVALTRQRESAQVFVARETARDAKDLARQMGRGEVRSASVAWATREEADRQRGARPAEPSRADRSAGQGGSAPAQDEDVFRRKVREALAARQSREVTPEVSLDRGQGAAPMPHDPKRGPGIRERDRAQRPDDAARPAPEPAPFLPAWHDPTGQGRDSLGRGTSPAELGRVADQDKEVLRHAEDRPGFLPAAYRNPRQAAAALDALIEKSGNDLRVAARRIGAQPDILGTLKGRVGWLANEAAHGERMQAKQAAWSIASKLNREADARDAAMDGYRQAVAQQHTRDAVAVPGLSKGALAVLDQVQSAVRSVGEQRADEGSDLHAQRIERAVAGVWKAGRADPSIAGELDRFIAAAGQRLGREGTAAAYAAFTKGAPMTVPGAGKEDQAGLDALARYLTLGRQAQTRSAEWQDRLDYHARYAERDRDDRGWDRGR
jgi:Ti-type conjugative transfer relaxase TraA